MPLAPADYAALAAEVYQNHPLDSPLSLEKISAFRPWDGELNLPPSLAYVPATGMVYSTKQDGFAAQVLASGGQFTVVFRGTDWTDTRDNGDWSNNLDLGWGKVLTGQVEDVQDLMNAVLTAAGNDRTKITVAGQSLGGGLAILAGTLFSVQTYAFDPAPFAKELQTLAYQAAATQLGIASRIGDADYLFASTIRALSAADTNFTELASQILAGYQANIINGNLIRAYKVDGEVLSAGNNVESIALHAVADQFGVKSDFLLSSGGGSIEAAWALHSPSLIALLMKEAAFENRTSGSTPYGQLLAQDLAFANATLLYDYAISGPISRPRADPENLGDDNNYIKNTSAVGGGIPDASILYRALWLDDEFRTHFEAAFKKIQSGMAGSGLGSSGYIDHVVDPSLNIHQSLVELGLRVVRDGIASDGVTAAAKYVFDPIHGDADVVPSNYAIVRTDDFHATLPPSGVPSDLTVNDQAMIDQAETALDNAFMSLTNNAFGIARWSTYDQFLRPTLHWKVLVVQDGDGPMTYQAQPGVINESHLIFGGAGGDTIYASGGIDYIYGGSGVDVFMLGDWSGHAGAEGSAYVYGGQGFDSASYVESPAGGTVLLDGGIAGNGTISATDHGRLTNDYLYSVEAIAGISELDISSLDLTRFGLAANPDGSTLLTITGTGDAVFDDELPSDLWNPSPIVFVSSEDNPNMWEIYSQHMTPSGYSFEDSGIAISGFSTFRMSGIGDYSIFYGASPFSSYELYGPIETLDISQASNLDGTTVTVAGEGATVVAGYASVNVEDPNGYATLYLARPWLDYTVAIDGSGSFTIQSRDDSGQVVQLNGIGSVDFAGQLLDGGHLIEQAPTGVRQLETAGTGMEWTFTGRAADTNLYDTWTYALANGSDRYFSMSSPPSGPGPFSLAVNPEASLDAVAWKAAINSALGYSPYFLDSGDLKFIIEQANKGAAPSVASALENAFAGTPYVAEVQVTDGFGASILTPIFPLVDLPPRDVVIPMIATGSFGVSHTPDGGNIVDDNGWFLDGFSFLAAPSLGYTLAGDNVIISYSTSAEIEAGDNAQITVQGYSDTAITTGANSVIWLNSPIWCNPLGSAFFSVSTGTNSWVIDAVSTYGSSVSLSISAGTNLEIDPSDVESPGQTIYMNENLSDLTVVVNPDYRWHPHAYELLSNSQDQIVDFSGYGVSVFPVNVNSNTVLATLVFNDATVSLADLWHYYADPISRQNGDHLSFMGDISLGQPDPSGQSSGGVFFYDPYSWSTDTDTVSVTYVGTAPQIGTLSVLSLTQPFFGTGHVQLSYQASATEASSTQKYAITVSDQHGNTATQYYSFDVSGSGPTASFFSSETITAAATATASKVVSAASGIFSFFETSLSSVHSVSVLPGSGANLGILTASIPTDSTGSGTGQVSWHYSVDESALATMKIGATAVDSFQIALDDGNGGVIYKTIEVTVSPDPDEVAWSATSDQPQTVHEEENSVDVQTQTGKIFFTDANVVDRHQMTIRSAGGATLGTFSAALTRDSIDGAGEIDWTYTVYGFQTNAMSVGDSHTDHMLVELTDQRGTTVAYELDFDIEKAAAPNTAPEVGFLNAGSFEAGVARDPINLLQTSEDPDAGGLSVVGGSFVATDPEGLLLPVSVEDGFAMVDTSQISVSHGGALVVSLGFDVTNGFATTHGTGSLTIMGPDAAPIVTTVDAGTTTQDGQAPVIDLLTGATDPDADPTSLVAGSVTAASSDGHQVSFSVDGHDVSFDPAQFAYLGAGEQVTVSIGFDVTDGMKTTHGSASIIVEGRNDSPVSAAIHAGIMAEISPPLAIDLLTGASDPDHNDVLGVSGTPVLTASDGHPVAATTSGSILTIDPAQFVYLAAGQSVTVTVAYAITDGTAVVQNIADFVVTGTNEAPAISPIAPIVAGQNDATVVIDLLGSATDADAGAVLALGTVAAVAADGRHVELSTAGGKVSIDPHQFADLGLGDSDLVSIGYDVTDGAATTHGTTTLAVIGANDLPVLAAVASQSAQARSGVVSFDLLDGASDRDADPLSLLTPTLIASDGHAVTGTVHSGTLSVDTAQFDYLTQGQTVTVGIDYAVSDGTGQTAGHAVLSVTGVDHAPVVQPLSVGDVLQTAAPLAMNLLAQTTDQDASDVLSVVPGSVTVTAQDGHAVAFSPVGTTLTIDPSQFAYLADGQRNGFTVAYDVTDGTMTTHGTVSGTMVGTDDAATISSIAIAATEFDPALQINLLSTARDVDSPIVLAVKNDRSLIVTASDGHAVAWSLNGNTLTIDPGQFDYLHAGQSLTVSVKYDATDGFTTLHNTASIAVAGGLDNPKVTPHDFGVLMQTDSTLPFYFGNYARSPDGGTLSLVPNSVSAASSDGHAAVATVSGSNIYFDPKQFAYLALNESVTVTIGYDVASSLSGTVPTHGVATVTVVGTDDAPSVVQDPTTILTGTTGFDTYGTIEGFLSASDIDGDPIRWKGGTDTAGATLMAWDTRGHYEILFNTNAANSYKTNVTITSVISTSAMDPFGGKTTQYERVNITDLNDAPLSVLWSVGGSVSEHAANGTTVGTLKAIDVDTSDTATWILIDSAGGRFALASNGSLTVANGSLVDYASSPSGYDIVVKGTDAGGLSVQQTVHVDLLKGLVATMTGTASNDTMTGTGGDDVISGLAGGDTINAGGGNDVVMPGVGSGDKADGGAGIDTLWYGDSLLNLSIDFQGTIFTNFENFVGGSGNDVIKGTVGDNVLRGSGGNDQFYGRGGNDYIDGGQGSDWVYFDTLTGGVTGNLQTQTVGGAAAGTTIVCVEGIVGGSGNDILTAFDNAPGYIAGGAGNDVLIGGAGADTEDGGAGHDVIYGSLGADVITDLDDAVFDYSASPTAVGFAWGSAAINAYGGFGGYADGDKITTSNGSTTNPIYEFVLSQYDDVIILQQYASATVRAGAGDDYVWTSDDLLATAIARTSTIFGGDGYDTIHPGTAGGIFIDFGNGGGTLDYDMSSSSVVSFNVSFIWGEPGTASTAELFSYSTSTKVATDRGTDIIVGDFGTFVGSYFNDTIIGNSQANVINGTAGFDIIDGGAGNDTITGSGLIHGGAGDDIITISTSNNSAQMSVYGDDGDDTIVFVNGPSTDIWGGAGANSIDVSEAVTWQIVHGGVGIDTIHGNANTKLTYADSTNGIAFDGQIGTAGDALGDWIIADSTMPKIYGSNHGDTFVGMADELHLGTGNNTVIGNMGVVFGNIGDDTIIGTANADTIHTGGGHDSITGGAGSDILYFDHPGSDDRAKLNYAYGDGSDTIYGFVTGKDSIEIAAMPGRPDPVVTVSASGTTDTDVHIRWYVTDPVAGQPLPSHADADIILKGVVLTSFQQGVDYHVIG